MTSPSRRRRGGCGQGERVKRRAGYVFDGKALRPERWDHRLGPPDRFRGSKCKRQDEAFISVVEDIGSRRDGEEARNRLAAIVESSDDAIISKGLNGIIASWNAGAERIFGIHCGRSHRASNHDHHPPELRDEEKEIISRLRNGERIDHYETVRVSKSGEKRNISLTVSPVRDSTGRWTGASKVARDITERKRLREAEEARRISEARLELALGSFQGSLFEWDMERSRGKWNSQMTSIYGFHSRRGRNYREEWRKPVPCRRSRQIIEGSGRGLPDEGRFPIRISSGSARPQTALDLIARPHPPGCPRQKPCR